MPDTPPAPPFTRSVDLGRLLIDITDVSAALAAAEESPMPDTPAQTARALTARLQQGDRLWYAGPGGAGELDAVRCRKGRLEAHSRLLQRWEPLHTVWCWLGDRDETLFAQEDTPHA